MVRKCEDQCSTVSQSGQFSLLAFGVTWIVGAWQVGPCSTWQNDYDVVRSLSVSAVDASGIVSTAVASVFRLLPIGTEIGRLGLAAAFCSAICAWFGCNLARFALTYDNPPSKYANWLALGVTLLAMLSETVQRAVAGANGSNAAAAICLVGIWLLVQCLDTLTKVGSHAVGDREERELFLVGGLVALSWLESAAAGLFMTVVVLALAALAWQRLVNRWRITLVAGFAATWLGVGLPWQLARRSLVAASVGRSMAQNLIALRPFSGLSARLGIWVNGISLAWCAVAVVGLALALLGRDRPRALWAIVTVVAATVLAPAESESPNCRELTAIIVGLVVLFAAAGRCVWEGFLWLSARKPSMGAVGGALALVIIAVGVLERGERAARVGGVHRNFGAEAWTDEAVSGLPARSVVLARNQAIVDHITAAQVATGLRPDVLVFPVERANSRPLVASLLATEPALVPVLRDLAINGRPSENSLSSLADLRPLYLEFDGTWDPRLRDHLLALPFLHRVFSQTLGRSDRALELQPGRRAVARVVESTTCDGTRNAPCDGEAIGDAMTRLVVAAREREQITLLLALGDRQAAATLLGDHDAVFQPSAWSKQLRRRIASTYRGSIDAFDLLAASDSTTQNRMHRE